MKGIGSGAGSQRSLELFQPSLLFPAISITGSRCECKCRYCQAKYVSSMIEAADPHQLYEALAKAAQRGALGVLVSGGFTWNARLPLTQGHAEALEKARRDYDLVIALHMGAALLSDYAYVCCDAVYVDLPLTGLETREVMSACASPEEFLATIDEAVAHLGRHRVCVHLMIDRAPQLSRIEDAARLLNEAKPGIVVVLVRIPSGAYEHLEPSVNDALKALAYLRSRVHVTLSLGCMRPRAKGLDWAVAASRLVDRIAVPKKGLAEALGLPVTPLCCGLPEDLLQSLLDRIKAHAYEGNPTLKR